MDEKLKYFLDAIEAQSWQDIEDIASSVAAEHERKTSDMRAQAVREAEGRRQSELSGIAQRERLSLDARKAENRRKLLQFRAEREDELMAELRERIAAYTADPGYPKRLEALLRKALEALGAPEGASLTVYLRPEDMDHAFRLRRSPGFGAISIREGDFALGGLILEAPDQGRRVDMSYDTSLRAAQERFGEIFNMEI